MRAVVFDREPHRKSISRTNLYTRARLAHGIEVAVRILCGLDDAVRAADLRRIDSAASTNGRATSHSTASGGASGDDDRAARE